MKRVTSAHLEWVCKSLQWYCIQLLFPETFQIPTGYAQGHHRPGQHHLWAKKTTKKKKKRKRDIRHQFFHTGHSRQLKWFTIKWFGPLGTLYCGTDPCNNPTFHQEYVWPCWCDIIHFDEDNYLQKVFLWAIKEHGRIPRNAQVTVALTLSCTWGSLSDREKHKIN